MTADERGPPAGGEAPVLLLLGGGKVAHLPQAAVAGGLPALVVHAVDEQGLVGEEDEAVVREGRVALHAPDLYVSCGAWRGRGQRVD